MEFIIYLGSSIGFSVLTAIVVVKYLGKKMIEHQLAKDLENHKQALSEKSMQLKNELTIYANEHTIKLTRLDLKRSEIIECIFNNYANIQTILAEEISKIIGYIARRDDNNVNIKPICTNDVTLDRHEQETIFDNLVLNNIKEMKSTLAKLLLEQKNLIFTNEIYFDNELIATMLEFLARNLKTLNGIECENTTINSKADRDVAIKNLEYAINNYLKTFTEEVNPIKKKLTDEFRKLLGSYYS